MWIRSQDKCVLGKFNLFDVDENISDEIAIIGCDGHTHINDKVVSAYELGVYNSKERAIEVLDEIQKVILGYIPIVNEKQYTGIATISTTTKQIVYEMPEE